MNSIDKLGQGAVFTGSIRPMDSWHQVGGSGEPAFQGTWVAFNSDGLWFIKDACGTVHISGRVKSGTINTVCFTLPVGYRPFKEIHMSAETSAAIGEVHVHINGDVEPVSGGTSDFSLEVSFYVGH